MAAFVGPAIQAGLGIYGAIRQNQQQKWLQDALMQIYNAGQAQMGQGNEFWRQTADPTRANVMSDLERLTQYLYGNEGAPGALTGLGDDISTFYGGLTPDFFQQSGLSPDMLESLAMLGGLGGQAQNFFGQTDVSPFYQQILGVGGPMAAGEIPGQRALGNLGERLLNTGGATDFTRNAADRAIQWMNAGGMTNPLQQAQATAEALISSGGRTPQLDRLSQAGFGALESGGLTEQGALGEATALDELINRGESPYSMFLGERGAELAGQDALIAPELAVSMARDQARAQTAGQAEAIRRAALARGGGPGAVTSAGVQNQALADLATFGQRAEADAVRNALLTQQQLQLQQQGQGAGMVGQGGQLAGQRLSTAGNLLSQLEDVATGRFSAGGQLAGTAEQMATQKILSALGLMPDIQGAATGVVNAYGGLGLGAGQLENARMGTGGDFLQTLMNSQLGGLGALQGGATGMGQFGLGMGQLAGDVTGQGLQGRLAGGRLGLDQMLGYTGARGQGFDLRGTLAGLAGNLRGQDLTALLGLSGLGMDQFRTGAGMVSGAFNQSPQGPNPISQLAGGMAQNFGNVDWGGLFQRQRPGFNVPSPGTPGGAIRFPAAP